MVIFFPSFCLLSAPPNDLIPTELKNDCASAKIGRFGAKVMESSAKLVCLKT